jgi:predicted GIY-YIG superfamily endonuclease
VRGPRCLGCLRKSCANAYLYVVVDARDGSFKIGCTVNPSGRLSSYRANGCTYFTFRFLRRAGCTMTASDREMKALGALERNAHRVRGDWFAGDVEHAVRAVERACEGLVEA